MADVVIESGKHYKGVVISQGRKVICLTRKEAIDMIWRILNLLEEEKSE